MSTRRSVEGNAPGSGDAVASLLLFTELVIQTTRSLAGDRAAYNPVRLLRSLRAFGRNRYSAQQQLKALPVPTPAGFHPDDWDNAEILERWTKELFDADGGQQARSSVTTSTRACRGQSRP